MTLALMVLTTVTTRAQSSFSGGDGSEGNPYQIATTDDLNQLATDVNSGNDYSNNYFIMTADITYTGGSETESNYNAIGCYYSSSVDYYFKGHFDGANHVIKGIRIYKGGTNEIDQNHAIFGRINGAEVKNIILADAYITGHQQIAGIVGYNNGGTVSNCHVLSDVTIKGYDIYGGVVSFNKGTVSGCSSAAVITTANNGMDAGGVVGANYNNAVLNDCLYLGTTVNGSQYIGAVVGANLIGASVTNSYYTISTAAAKAVGWGSGTVGADVFLAPQDDKDNTAFFALLAARNTALTAVSRTPVLSTAVDLTYRRTLYTDGNWNTLCLPFSLTSLAGTPLEGFTVKELDTETACNGHKTGYKNGTLYLNFKDATSMEAGKPYIVKKKDVEADLVINSDDDWNTFAQNVSNGTSYDGQVVRLGASISVSTMAGTSDCPFKGTFDGNGHTISLNLNGGGEALALFYIIDGATIQNVKVTGTITSSNHRPATFTAFANGNSTIKNCWSSVDIVSTRTSSWVDGGAFVARVSTDATLNMTDCLFTGSITYHGGTSGGGMVGFTQTRATANLTNCLFSPTALTLTVNAYNPCVFVSGDERGNLTNCYYNVVAKASVLTKEGIDGSGMGTDALASALGANWEVCGNNVLPNYTSGINNPIFASVTINSAAPTAVTSEDGAVKFLGNYNPVSIGNEGDNTILIMGAKSTLYYPDAAMSINAFRGWLQLAKALPDASTGDVNGDGSISVSDVTMLVGHILGEENDDFIISKADVNGDGEISVSDVTALVSIILSGSGTFTIVTNLNDIPITFGGGGSGPARVVGIPYQDD